MIDKPEVVSGALRVLASEIQSPDHVPAMCLRDAADTIEYLASQCAHDVGTLLVFAARYAHDRQTGGALAVVTAARKNWHLLTDDQKRQLQRESEAATANCEDWQALRELEL